MRKPPSSGTAALVILVLCVAGPMAARADIMVSLSVDTNSLSGQGGFLDIQFNPGDSTAEAATAVVTSFVTNGVLAQPATDTGDAAGSLPGTLTLDNGTAYNDIFQGITFGTSLSFSLDLSGPAVSAPGGNVGSSFALSLYAADGITPLLTTDPNGSVATVNLSASGTASAEIFPQSATDSTPAASVTVNSQNIVPEPSTIVLAIAALPIGVFLWSRRRARRHSEGDSH